MTKITELQYKKLNKKIEVITGLHTAIKNFNTRLINIEVQVKIIKKDLDMFRRLFQKEKGFNTIEKLKKVD